MEYLDSKINKEMKLQKELSLDLKLEFIYKAGFALEVYQSLNYLLDGKYTQTALLSVPTMILGGVLMKIRNEIKKSTNEKYVPIPSLTIPVGIILSCYALNELYHSLLNGPLLNP